MRRSLYISLFLVAGSRPAHAQTPPASADSATRPAQIETVLVTERPFDNEIERTPGGIALVDGEALRERNVASLADLLRYVPGVWAASEAGSDDMFFSSRGSNLDATDYDMNGIRLLQDGLPVTTADGNNHNRVLDPLAARWATIARGANALVYGASTLGGAVDFVSPTAHDAAPLAVFANAGSHGQRLVRTTASRVFGERFDALVTLEGKAWDGYRAHNEQRRAGVYANAGWRLPNGAQTRFYLTRLSNDQEIAGPLTRAQAAAAPAQASASALGGDYRLDVDTLRLAGKTTWPVAGGTLDVGLSYERQALFHPIVDKVLVDFDGTGPAAPVEVFSLLIDTDHRDWATTARYAVDRGAHELSFGATYAANSVDGGHYRNDGGRPNGLTALVANRAATLDLVALDRWRIDERWRLELAMHAVAAERNVRNTSVADGAVRNPHGRYSSANPRIGVIRSIGNRVDLFANLSRPYEPPTSYELEDEASGGGATLAAMRGTVLEVGGRGRHGLGAQSEWRWDVAVYQARLEDEILSVEDPARPGESLAANVDRTVHAGLEALLGADFALRSGARVSTLLSVTLNDFAFDADPVYGDNRLPAAPRRVLRGEALWRSRGGFFIGPTFDVVTERFADFANTYTVPSYTLVGLRAGRTQDNRRWFAELRNLHDRNYVATHTVRNRAFDGDAVLNPGEPRSLYVGFELEL